jgi:hypothetical protein
VFLKLAQAIYKVQNSIKVQFYQWHHIFFLTDDIGNMYYSAPLANKIAFFVQTTVCHTLFLDTEI